MKKITLIMVLVLSITAFAACGKKEAEPSRDNPLKADDTLTETLPNYSVVIEYTKADGVRNTMTYKAMPGLLYYKGARGLSEADVIVIVDYTAQTYIVTSVDTLDALKMDVNETVKTVDYEPTKFLYVDIKDFVEGAPTEIAGRPATTYTKADETVAIDDETGVCLSYAKSDGESWAVLAFEVNAAAEVDFVLPQEYEINDLTGI
jgi:hypothetical protein